MHNMSILSGSAEHGMHNVSRLSASAEHGKHNLSRLSESANMAAQIVNIKCISLHGIHKLSTTVHYTECEYLKATVFRPCIVNSSFFER